MARTVTCVPTTNMKRTFFVPSVVLCVLVCVSVPAAQFVKPALLGPGVNAEGFFDDTKLHSIYISINSKDWQSLRDHFLDNTYYQCDMKWQDLTVRNIGIRSRGTGSRDQTKPGLRVDFDRYTTDQKFLNLKSFILRNNTQDASGMHERLSIPGFLRGTRWTRIAGSPRYLIVYEVAGVDMAESPAYWGPR